MASTNRLCAALLAAFVALFSVTAAPVPAIAAPSAPNPHGRPKITLDRLDLSKVPLAASDETFLRHALAEEAARADWGAGRGAHIEFRFRLDELSVSAEPKVLRVHCAASGFLPKGRGAKSRIAFGGEPQNRQALVRHVLEIVARGVVTRLSDLERRRRAP